MYLFFEKGMTDGVSYIYKRYSKASNKYLKSYGPKQESKHIIYLDENRLYGYIMSKFLPISGFKWTNPKQFGLNKYTINTPKGCVLELYCEYSKELCELQDDNALSLDKKK